MRKALLNDFAIEIGGGLGQFAGKVWRVGLMGHSCRRKNVFLFLAALEAVLKSRGLQGPPGRHRGGNSGLCVRMIALRPVGIAMLEAAERACLWSGTQGTPLFRSSITIKKCSILGNLCKRELSFEMGAV